MDTVFPSINPQGMPDMRARPAIGDGIDSVDPLAGVMPNGVPLTPQGPNADLLFIRAQYPFVPILAFPNVLRTVTLVANVVQDIDIDQGIVIARFVGSADFWLSHGGRASIGDPSTMFKPDYSFFYVGGIRQVSVFSQAACTVQMQGYFANNWPK